MKVVHVISGLKDGGAEAVLYRLCSRDASSNHHVVVSLAGMGRYGHRLVESNVTVKTLGMTPGRFSLRAFWRLFLLLRKENPNVVQTWMYHADLIGGVAARLAGFKNLVWGVHHSTLEVGSSKRIIIWIARLAGQLSWLPAKIIVCSQRAMVVHESLGYPAARMRFVPNGYDLTAFCRQPEAGQALKATLGLSADVPLIGTVGRYNPQKDHANLLRALAILKQRNTAFTCILVGTDMTPDNHELVALIKQLDLADCVYLLGVRQDIPVVMSALDLHVLSSSSEAFPNVVAEAMACETPNVVTDVGDAAYIVGETGWVVPPKDAQALAAAIESALAEQSQPSWPERGAAARRRVANNFSIDQMVNAYHQVWNQP